MPPKRSLAHRALSALFRLLAPTLLRAELIVSDATCFGIDPFNDIARLAHAWAVPIHTLFDIGANDGHTALELHSRFPNARIFSFEPHPETFARLSAATRRVPHILTTQIAFADSPGTLPMSVYTESRVNTLKPSFHEAGRFESSTPIDVPVTTVDTFCSRNDIDAIDLLKIDTEGFDLNVLQGASEILQRGNVRFIYVECNDLQVAPTDPGTGLLTIDHFLRPFGYRFIATYNDYNNLDGRLFQSSNALFALPPQHR